ncbi:hypothetical protein ZOSMA_34G00220 [Zostera marina]|uniref:Uncharacterized protein n=1 Tax=Zostera marina TaxID=29655 RepID=A0A0K9P6U1_ZOSMR|nr:hypothetical protein ZOSMA_34G00220 [Zostera marina]
MSKKYMIYVKKIHGIEWLNDWNGIELTIACELGGNPHKCGLAPPSEGTRDEEGWALQEVTLCTLGERNPTQV